MDAATGDASLVKRLNTTWHKRGMWVFFVIVVAHWTEHLVQAGQIWLLGWNRADSRGVLGQFFPKLVTEEWLHLGYAVIMLAGLAILAPGFKGRGGLWWKIALGIQVWHFVEHFLLWVQAMTNTIWWGKEVPNSIAQLFFPRVELHLFYNAVVFAPMLVAMYFHMVPPRSEWDEPVECTCRMVPKQWPVATAA